MFSNTAAGLGITPLRQQNASIATTNAKPMTPVPTAMMMVLVVDRVDELDAPVADIEWGVVTCSVFVVVEDVVAVLCVVICETDVPVPGGELDAAAIVVVCEAGAVVPELVQVEDPETEDLPAAQLAHIVEPKEDA